MIDWRAVLPLAGGILKASAASYGPLAVAITDFAVDAVEFTIDAVESGQDKIAVIQGMQTRVAKLMVELEGV
jgi:hypothetical protein